MADPSPFAPVVLSPRPTCINNLSWSDDHLAVATDGVIHIITPRDHVRPADADSNYWHIETVSVSRFSEAESPLVQLASLSDLSLREGQSNSSVCSFAWSSVGIGLHKRHVLAVLTTNLLLSLWESTGVPGSWRRTYILNSLIAADEIQPNRRIQRVRAFAWLPGLHADEEDRREQQFLITVDGTDKVCVFHLAKANLTTDNSWHIPPVYTYQLVDTSSEAPKGMPMLRRTLLGSPITRIDPGRWQKSTDQPRVRNVVVSFTRGPGGSMCPNLVLSCRPDKEGWTFDGYTRDRWSPPHGLACSSPSGAIEAALAKPKSKFNAQFKLQGHVRVRHWGNSRSPDGRVEATCVTFHPSDIVDDNTFPDFCTIVFAQTAGTRTEISNESPKVNPRLELLRWLAAHASIESIKTDLDVKVVRVAAACIYAAFNSHASLMEWSRAAAELTENFDAATDADDEGDNRRENGSQFIRATIAEPCEICSAAISIGQDLLTGRCSRGHTFARCGISFLAIQEPGISKYCSRCGKEFLDFAKLEPHEGPSLSLALFEEFDVCPYCRGKFHG